MIKPEPGMVIENDLVHILLSVPESMENTIDSIVFYADYQAANMVQVKGLRLHKTDRMPYEYVWDCSQIPEQDLWRINIYAHAFLKNRTTLESIGKGYRKYLVLDRTPELKTVSLSSTFGTVKIDGMLDEWGEPAAFQTFKNNDNIIQAASKWDDEFLYFGIKVEDKYINAVAEYDTSQWDKRMTFSYYKLWTFDNIELCFDIRHDHNMLKNTDDREIMINPSGFFQGNIVDVKNETIREWATGSIVKGRILGSLNDNSDADSCYVIEAALPWNIFGLSPKNNLSLGFDIFNGDNETGSPQKWVAFATWSGVKANNNDNPSEWGNLMLIGRGTPMVYTAIVLGIGVLILIGVFLKKRSGPKDETHLVQTARKYVLENISRPDLKVEHIAQHMNFSPAYFSNLFNKEAGISFPQFLNNIRIDESVKLLRGSSLTLSQVAFQVGYNNYEHFSRVFKQKMKTSPKAFREAAQNS